MARLPVGAFVADSVECSECGNRYDSERMAFCPRCGSQKQEASVAGAVPLSTRDAGIRRRVQAAGVMLLVMGILTGITWISAIVLAEDLLEEAGPLFEDAPGGALTVHAHNAGAPANATLSLHALNGTALPSPSPNATGWWNVSMADRAVIVVHVTAGNDTWNRTVISLEGGRAFVELDLSTAPKHQSEWLGGDDVATAVRMTAGFFLFMSVFVVLGGIAAMRTKRRSVALAGSGAGLLPAIIVFAAMPWPGILVLLPMGAAFMLILQGRRVIDK